MKLVGDILMKLVRDIVKLDKSKGRKSIYGILENIPKYRKLYILILSIVILLHILEQPK